MFFPRLTRLTRVLARPLAIAFAIAMLLVATADYYSGERFTVYVLYFPIVAVGCWVLGMRAAVVLSIFASVLWIADDVFAPPEPMPYAAKYWQAITRFVVFVAFAYTLTRLRAALARERYLSRYDELTGLSNLASLFEIGKRDIARCHRSGQPLTAVFIDLDDFKQVNDHYGHAEGDKVLQAVATAIRQSTRETDIAARIGGDEFAIIQEDAANQHEGAIALALRIIHAVSEPFDLDGHEASIGTSIGIALAPENGVEPEALLKSADLALYDAKANGRNDFRIYHSRMLENAHSQQSAEAELRDAIAREQFQLHYQPVVDVKTRRLCGVEALVRWRHPEAGVLMPNQFVPVAEECGQIVRLGRWVLMEACRALYAWRGCVAGGAGLRISVNISGRHLQHGALLQDVARPNVQVERVHDAVAVLLKPVGGGRVQVVAQRAELVFAVGIG